ncbi:MAG: pilin [Pseudomonadota bacterium]|jgi:type IV pilus assembly protein PilA
MKKMQGFTLIELMIVVAILGILMVIAVPAYSDYTVRGRISEGMSISTAATVAVAETRLSTGAWPTTNALAGLGNTIASTFVTGVAVGAGGNITITYNTAAGRIPEVAGANTLILNPTFRTNTVQWECAGGTLVDRFRPARCR